MANAMRCDRCGKFYIENTRVKGRRYEKGEVIGGVKICAFNWDVDDMLDLCDDCVEKLYEFLDNKKGETSDDKN